MKKRNRKQQDSCVGGSLTNDEAKNKMFCSACCDYATGKQYWRSSYVVGHRIFKMEGSKDHERSTLQEHCIKVVQTKKDPRQADEARLVKLLMQQQTEKIILIFQTAHAVAKKARPCLDFLI